MRTVLFICTGNTCRSPMAEAVAQHWLDERSAGGADRVLAVSAGVAAGAGAPRAREAVHAIEELGMTLDGRSKPLSLEMIRNASVVFGMTSSHVASARSLAGLEPKDLKKILPLDPDGDVEDPIGMGQPAYDALARRFVELVPERLKEVLAHEDRTGVRSPRSNGDSGAA